jgi:hypothetical protein
LKKIEQFQTSDGRVFKKEEDAILRERILEKLQKLNTTKLALEKIKDSCEHTTVKPTTPCIKERYISGEDGSGGSCVIGTVRYRNFACLVCNKSLEYIYDENDTVLKIVEGW